MIVIPITEENENLTLEVVKRLRSECVTELTATRAENNSEDALIGFLRDLQQLRRFAMTRLAFFLDATDGSNGVPIAILNVYRSGAVEASFQMFSTPSWPLIAGPAVRWIRANIIPQLIEHGIQIGDCSALIAFEKHRLELDRWFSMLDCFPCGPALPRGKNGELFQHYVWRAPAIAGQVEEVA